MGQYGIKGGYSGYKKNNAEREALDYYSTPTEEVFNILNILGIDFTNHTILENSVGGGHMIKGVEKYLLSNEQQAKNIITTDIKNRGWEGFSQEQNISKEKHIEYNLDFLADDYPYIENIDTIIMNPPFSTIEPFVMKSLEIAQKYVILLGRLQFVESESRFKNIFKTNPPTAIFQYVDRISCYKNGDINIKGQSAQAYAWFLWDCQSQEKTTFDWIRRYNKREVHK